MQVPLRDPKIVMKLSRLGSFHQSKLSFLRSFLNEFKDWKYNRDLFDLNDRGYGVAIYSFSKDKKTYSLVCFANELKDEERSDRVIATKWDAAFALYDGIPSKIDIDRLSQNVPKQEVGRLSYKELTLSRANRSVRAFNYVVECLSKGIQPNTNELSKVGYLYRTTAVYGSGKFGLADRFRIKNRDEINGPFRLEMMLVYLVRQFTFDQVNHIAKHKNPKDAVELDLDICRNLGIGNSTGLGMAPFIVNHPSLLNNWILAKETALKKIREIEKVSEEARNFITNENVWLGINKSDNYKNRANKVPTLISSWRVNYLSWKNKIQNYLIVKYEDLLENPQKEFFKIVKFMEKLMDCKFEDEKINNAITSTSFQTLQKLEEKGLFTEQGQGAKFFNSGPNADWKSQLNKNIIDEINLKFKNEMLELGYL